jgi:hypothetical protein
MVPKRCFSEEECFAIYGSDDKTIIQPTFKNVCQFKLDKKSSKFYYCDGDAYELGLSIVSIKHKII